MSNLPSNIIAFIVALGVIIFVHELGHLLMAKRFGMRVLAFSLGFGKRIWGFRRGGTDYKVALIPLGGYVRLSGENPDEASNDPSDFLNRPRWQRVMVYLAGPAMNVVLSLILIAVVFMVGIEVPTLAEIPPVVGIVAEGSPAEAAGLRPGDQITSVDGEPVEEWDEVHFALITSPERPVALELLRDGERISTRVTPAAVPRYEFGDAGVYPRVLPRIAQVMPGRPAEEAGFRAGDEVRAVEGQAVASSQDFVAHIEERAGERTEVRVVRDGEVMTLTVVPADVDGKGKIGVMVGYYQRYGPLEALIRSVRYNIDIVRQTFAALNKIVTGRLAAKSALSGPIEIAAMSGAAARSGINNLLHLMGIISISIGILNLLPIPILDGGQITILLVESLFRRDLSLAVKERINQIGLVMIVMLMVMVLYFDLAKNLPPGVLPGS